MVTSANDAKTVNDAVRLGAVDYLVKPFAYERFQQALEVFCRRRESVQRDSFSQDALDHTLFRQTGAGAVCCSPEGSAKPDSCADRGLSARRAGRAAHER